MRNSGVCVSWYFLGAGYGSMSGLWLGRMDIGRVGAWDYSVHSYAMAMVGLSLGFIAGACMDAILRRGDTRRLRHFLLWVGIVLFLLTLLLAPIAYPVRE
jgi:hypothetical protein